MALLKKKAPEKRFQYKPLTTEFMETRKNQRGGDSDGFVSPTVKVFSPADGDNTVRILPAFGIDSSYGYEIFAHYGIGSDNSAYLCLKAMKDEPDPVCEEKERAMKAGDDEYAKALRSNKRIAVYVIDRAKEGDGPKLWFMPYTLEREMAAQAMDKKSGKVIQFIDPDEGYDFNFTKQGKQLTTKYIGAAFDREPSPLSDDSDTAAAWLSFVEDNPIPGQLVYHDYDHIAKQFSGAAKDAASESGTKKGKFSKKAAEVESGVKVSVTWQEVQEADEDEIIRIAKKHGLNEMEETVNTLEEAQAYVCEHLGLTEPKIEGGKKPFKAKLKLGGKKETAEEPVEEETAEELPTWDEVHAMEDEALVEFGNAHEVDMTQEFIDLEDAQNKVCEALDIEQVEKKPLKLGGKLSKLRAKSSK